MRAGVGVGAGAGVQGDSTDGSAPRTKQASDFKARR